VLLPGGRVVFVELKRPGETVKDKGKRGSQGRFGKWLLDHGFEWTQIDSKEKIDALISQHKKG
jgi:hypothetical protein